MSSIHFRLAENFQNFLVFVCGNPNISRLRRVFQENDINLKVLVMSTYENFNINMPFCQRSFCKFVWNENRGGWGG